jgi:dolichol-phosphate mannosyltransferase
VVEVIRRVRAVEVGMEKEILVIDGASRDGTREAVAELAGKDVILIAEDVARGKGTAVRTGFEHASGDIVLIQDADLELDPAEFPRLLAPLVSGAADAVLGVRFAHGRGTTPWIGYLGNRGLSLTASVLFGTWLNDILTAYKVMRTDIARSLPLRCKGFDLDAELVCQLVKRGLRLVQVPVHYEPRTVQQGKKLGRSAAWGVLLAIFRVRLQG